MLQMIISRRSSRPRHIPPASFGATIHKSPSGGRQSFTARPNGLNGTSNSRSRLSRSASLLSTWPKARTKWPSGYREVMSQRSMLTRIFWLMRDGAWRVRSRMRGMDRETGVAKTVCWVVPVARLLDKEVRSMWHTYLHGNPSQRRPTARNLMWPTHALQFLFIMPTTLPVGWRFLETCVVLRSGRCSR